MKFRDVGDNQEAACGIIRRKRVQWSESMLDFILDVYYNPYHFRAIEDCEENTFVGQR